MTNRVICISLNASGSKFDSEIVYYDGISYTNDGVLISPMIKQNPDEIKDSDGEWLLIVRDREGLNVHTDMYGYYTVFYSVIESEKGSFLALSDNFSSICSLVNSYNSVEIDESYCLPILASFTPFFNTSHSLKTSHLLVKKLAPLQKIKICNGAYSLEEDYEFDKYQGLSYDELLSFGIESISRKYSSFVKENYEPVFYLLGGKDSRACLAACKPEQSSGYFFSQNPNNYPISSQSMIQDDYNIAADLAEKIGLKRFVKGQALLKAVGFEEHFNIVTSMNSNKTNMYNPSVYFGGSEASNDKIQIRGGGGEVLRSYWSDYFNKIGVADGFVGKNGYGNWKDYIGIFNKLVSRSLIGNIDKYKKVQDDFVNELLAMNKDSANETLEEHYFFHRNRYHFGHLRSSLTSGNICYMPLSNKFLFMASRKMSFEERSKGKLLYDLILKANSDLDKVEYESEGWGWESSDVNKKRNKAIRKEVESSFYPNSKMVQNSSLPFFAKGDFLKNKHYEISEEIRGNDCFSFINDKLFNFLKNKVDNKDSSQVVQKLSSVLDAASKARVNTIWLY